MDSINKISYIIKDNIPIPVSTVGSDVDLIEIELQGNHDYLLFGNFTNSISENITIISSFDYSNHGVNIRDEDYEFIFSGNQTSNMSSGGGTISIMSIRTFKDIKVIYRLWNYLDSQNYTVDAKTMTIMLR